jgi:hypothetical protein
MKRYTSKNEIDWYVLPEVVLSEEQITVMKERTEKEKAVVIEAINLAKEPVQLDGEELDFCLSVYAKYKPEVKEGDDYTFLSFDFASDGVVNLGAYNYKLNKNINNVILK